MADPMAATPPRRPPLDQVAVGLWVVATAALVILGADLMWVVALGDEVRAGGETGSPIPFATAAQVDWPNPYVVAEVLLSLVHSSGSSALATLQVVLVASVLSLVALELRRAGAPRGRAALVVSLVAVGCSSAFVVARFPALSLPLFVLLVLLLRREAERPRVSTWLVPPLLVLWANLHGAVLVGLAVLGVFTVTCTTVSLRRRLLVAVPSLALFVLTSAGTGTPRYFLLALGNEAAAQRSDLWAPPSLASPLDVAMIVAAAVMLLLAARRLRPWEWLVTAGLAVGTGLAARNGSWLVLFLAVSVAGPAAAAVAGSGVARRSTRTVVTACALAVATAVASGALLATRSEEVGPPGSRAAGLVREIAGEGAVLAKEPEAETLAQQGLTVWAANPIDAFRPEVQRQFLDFLHDCEVPPAELAAVVTDDECEVAVSSQGWQVAGRSGDLVILVPRIR